MSINIPIDLNDYVLTEEMTDKSITSFDICQDSPKTIAGLARGFIHSPCYPKYYTNSKECYIKLETNGKRLVIYMITMNMEGKGFFTGQPNDFLQINNDSKYYGPNNPQQIIYNGTDEFVPIKFKTDYGTSTYLEEPKGFLVYFERK